MLREFENRILRRIFGPSRDEKGKWRKLHNEELHNLYLSSNIIWVIKYRKLGWTDHVPRMKEVRSAFKMLTSKSKAKRPLEKPIRGWENNIRVYLKEISTSTRNWVDSAQDRDC